ncbi:MAG: T9SS type A sorting domain-containing protein, partial [Flavobacteriales bacterium]|nr:T9SS type A sorting domain-containing protein [Flavobacteriales bacterium]
ALSLFYTTTINAQTELWGISTNYEGKAFLYSTDGNAENVVERLEFNNDYFEYGLLSPSSSEFCIANNGKLYITISDGGENGNGGIVEFDPNTNRCIPVYYFDNTVGGYKSIPTKHTLIKASNGKLYGTIKGGTLNGEEKKNIIYEFDTNNYTFTEKYVFDFDIEPRGKLVQLADDNFYGTATTNNVGHGVQDILYKFNLNSSTFSIIKEFRWGSGEDPDDGIYPSPYLIEGESGVLYGLTILGGEPDQSRNRGGTLFSYNTNNSTYSQLVSFSGQDNVGANPRGSLVKGTNGNLYGIVSSVKIFKYNPTSGELSSVGDAPSDHSQNDASHTLMLANNGRIMGMTSSGVIYSFDPTVGTIDTELETTRSSNIILTEVNNNFYAIVNHDENDIYGNKGAIIKFDNNNKSYENIFSFGHTNFRGIPSNYASIIEGSNGCFYGVSTTGVATFFGGGAIFEYDPITDYFQNIHIFYSNKDGRNPEGKLLLSDNNRLYGYTSKEMFEYDLTNKIYKQVVNFGKYETSGSSSPIQASNGKIYGMVNGNPYGDEKPYLFEYDINTKNYQIKFDFGTLPLNINGVIGSLIEYNGKLYGLVSNGNSGYLFEYNMSTSDVAIKVNFYKSTKLDTGIGPNALILASNNKLYGVTGKGGTSDIGILFEYNPTTEIFTKKMDFNLPDGKYPQGGLMQASNGKLYGRAWYGGSENISILYEYDITTETYSVKIEYPFVNYNMGALFDTNPSILKDDSSFNIDKKNIAIYPNPAIENISIKSDINISKIEIYNQQGQLVLFSNKKQNINVSMLNS